MPWGKRAELMKVCSYCGHKNPDEAQTCASCGSDLLVGAAPQTEPSSRRPQQVSTPVNSKRSSLLSAGFFENAAPLDVSKVDMGFSFDEGFSWPDWKKIGQSIRNSFPKEQWPQAWREAGIEWLAQLKQDLGGEYEQYESWNFLLLSAEGREYSETILRVAEEVAGAIESGLGSPVHPRELYGKRVILAFNEEDDYYTYISHYYPVGHFSRSSGMFIVSGGYGHIAFPFVDVRYVRRTLIHELTHNCLMVFRLPRWLNEGLAVRVEKELGRNVGFRGVQRPEDVLDQRLALEHRAFWKEQNIQEFWAGISYLKPGRSNKLSYSLGHIMVELLAVNWADFLSFVQNADPRDAGQDAALKCLDRDLGETLARFLGLGEWRPDRKAIADLWNQQRA